MAIKHYDVTLGAAATQISSTHKPCVEIIIQNTNGNSAIYIGDSTVTNLSYGHTLAADGILALDGTACSINIEEVYIFGTADDVVHVLANIL